MQAFRPISLSICILTSFAVRHCHSKSLEEMTSSRQWKPWGHLWDSAVFTTLRSGPKLFDGYFAGVAYQMSIICIPEQSGKSSALCVWVLCTIPQAIIITIKLLELGTDSSAKAKAFSIKI